MPAPDQVLQLVDHFHTHLPALRAPGYNEAQVRIEFINPLFEALGWDIANRRGLPLDQREVITETTVRVGRALKAPDYAFGIGGARKFFVEAKEPGVNLDHNPAPALQLRVYGWNAGLPLSILTDFEEFAVYDCRYAPDQFDLPTVARVDYFKYTDYPDRWDTLAGLFSRDAVLAGALDRYADQVRTRKGAQGVDQAFLREIERWRDLLAQDIARRNPSLTVADLNYAVQMTIDRLIFLRIAEDRGLERYERLLDTIKGAHVYDQLAVLFAQADQRYNSGLFHFAPEKGRERQDTLTLDLAIGDHVLTDIIKHLYYPSSPYTFDVMPVEVLGQIYEQFLGKVITLDPHHRAAVQEKPEVRKAGGVYYTPAYIVDYIVEHTLGPLLADKTPADFTRRADPATLRVLDPACGSGSFLLGAYQYLLTWYRDQYTADPARHKTRLRQLAPNDWRLTLAERKRILLDHIYGVDIDSQAVEVTKLSLLLKLLEGETDQSVAAQLSLFHERALPDLAANIQCGNSLVGPDYLDGRPYDPDEARRVNPFDWPAAFPAVFHGDTPGFDAVIGNPPYLRIQGLQTHYSDQVPYLARQFVSATKRYDLYILFIERGFTLLAGGGRLGFICPNKFLNADLGSGLRDFLATHHAVDAFISFGNNLIFNQAATYTGILLLEKGHSAAMRYYEFPNLPPVELPVVLSSLEDWHFNTYDLASLSNSPWVLTLSNARSLLDKISVQPSRLGEIFDQILVGVQSGIDGVHVLQFVATRPEQRLCLYSQRANAEVEIEAELVKPLLTGQDVHRYIEPTPRQYCIYPYEIQMGKTTILEEEELLHRYPLGYAYLSQYRDELAAIRARQKTNVKYWYSCHRSRDMNVFERDRIVTPEISLGCNMTIAPGGLYNNTQVYSLVPSPGLSERQEYWLGLLNASLTWWFLANTGTVLRGGYFRFKTNYLNPLPIRRIDFSSPADVARHDQLVTLVERMLDLHQRLAAAHTPADRTTLERAIAATDKEIDHLVYALYDLTPAEIALVEAATTP